MASLEKRTWWSRYRMTERLKDDGFLEAAINAGFLVAAADGAASEVEYDALLDRLEILGGVDRDAIDDKLASAARHLEGMGLDARVARVAELVGDRDSAAAVMMLGMAIAFADAEITEDERHTATKLAAALGIQANVLDSMTAELHV